MFLRSAALCRTPSCESSIPEVVVACACVCGEREKREREREREHYVPSSEHITDSGILFKGPMGSK